MKIEKKCQPQYFQEIIDGQKNFEVRLADWPCQPGDILVLREWDAIKKNYTGRVVEKEVTNVIKTKDLTFFPDEDIEKFGWQIIGFK